jgi:hypothetical protein
MTRPLGTDTDDGTLYRGTYVWWIMVAFWGFIFLLLAGTALNSTAPAAGRAFAAVGCVLLGAWAVVTRRAGILVDHTGLVVRRYSGRCIAVPWPEVDRIEPRSNGKGGAWIAVITTEGRVLRTQGLAANSVGSKWAARVIADMQRHRPRP